MSALPSFKSLGAMRSAPRYSLRVLAHLLAYPGAQLRAALPQLRGALYDEAALSARRLRGIEALMESLAARDAFEVEAGYVDLFDRGRATSLHLFEHVHGDSRDRGTAMIDLLKTYAQNGLYLDPAQAHGELPDYLPVVLEFVSTLAPEQALGFVGEIAHILNAIHAALLQRHSLYAHVLAAALELGGQDVEAVDVPEEEALDAAWAEPEVFSGCSSKGQHGPDQVQPIQIVRRQAANTARGAST